MSDSQALKVLMKSPVTQDMISHLVNVTLKVVPCKKSTSYPSPASSPSSKRTNQLPSLMTFISRIVRYTNVYAGTLLCTQVYLERLSSKLPKNAEGLPCTLHRIFLACLIISAKFNNDSSPKNKHWAKYTEGLFKLEDVNLMERQLLQLMNWDVTVSEDDLCRSLKRLTDPIKQDLKKAARFRRTMTHQRQKPLAPQCPLPSPMEVPAMYYQQQHSRSHSASSISSLSSSVSMDSISSVESVDVMSQKVVNTYKLYPSQMKESLYPSYTHGQQQLDQSQNNYAGNPYLPSIWA